MTSRSRPSEKFGTHSISFLMVTEFLDRIYAIDRIARKANR
jgi:hypothetical protein